MAKVSGTPKFAVKSLKLAESASRSTGKERHLSIAHGPNLNRIMSNSAANRRRTASDFGLAKETTE